MSINEINDPEMFHPKRREETRRDMPPSDLSGQYLNHPMLSSAPPEWIRIDTGDLVHLTRLDAIELRRSAGDHVIFGSAGNHAKIAMFRRKSRQESKAILFYLSTLLGAVSVKDMGPPVEGPRGSFG